jgi:multidrug resistance efflux pump
MPDPDPIRTKVDKALVALQELEKQLRNLRNRGDATELEVELAKEAIEALRQLAKGRGYSPPDIDSRPFRRESR